MDLLPAQPQHPHHIPFPGPPVSPIGVTSNSLQQLAPQRTSDAAPLFTEIHERARRDLGETAVGSAGTVSVSHNQYKFDFSPESLRTVPDSERERLKEFMISVRVMKCPHEHYEYDDYTHWKYSAIETHPQVIRVLFYDWGGEGLSYDDLRQVRFYKEIDITDVRVQSLPMPGQYTRDNVLTLIVDIKRQSLVNTGKAGAAAAVQVEDDRDSTGTMPVKKRSWGEWMRGGK